MVAVEHFSTPSMHLILRADDILEMAVPSNWKEPDTLETARENVALLFQVLEGKNCAILVEPINNHLNREILACYREVGKKSTATALLTNSFSSRIVGNVYLKLMKMTIGTKRPTRPIKLFNNKEDATQWLLQCLQKKKAVAEKSTMVQ